MKAVGILSQLEPSLGDANAIPIFIAHIVRLRIRFNDSLFHVPCFVAYKLSFPMILGTQFLIEYCRVIICQQNKFVLKNVTRVSIIE